MSTSCEKDGDAGMTQSTEGDSFHFVQECQHMPALGHHFGPELECDYCGTGWEHHQHQPEVCPSLLERAQHLENLRHELRDQQAKIRALRKDLEQADIQLRMIREFGIHIPTKEEATKWNQKRIQQAKEEASR